MVELLREVPPPTSLPCHSCFQVLCLSSCLQCEFLTFKLILLILHVSSLFLFTIGSVKLWDPRQKEKPVAVMEPVDGEQRRDCWSVTFGM
jgi:hypothetical protein